MARRRRQCGAWPVPESATEQIEHALARLRATEAKVHAYAQVDERQARAAAEAADAATSRGPLHGLPFAVKEVIEVAGIPTSGGCRAIKDHIPDRDATVVRRLRDSGAILVGTQVSHELTCGLDQPPTRNPWNIECYPGGSSAGAGVSVALGSAGVALGTDAAGSVRIPAAMTGAVGMKPTAGLVSKHGVLRQASAPSIDNVGIIGKRVSEVARVFAVIAGPDPGDADTLQQFNETVYDQDRNSSTFKGLRVAVLGDATRAALDELWPMNKEIDAAFNNVCEQLKDAGAQTVTIELPGLAQAIPAVVTFFSTELAAAHCRLVDERSQDYHPEVHALLKQALDTPAETIMDAMRTRVNLRKEISRAFKTAEVEFLLTPTTPRVAMPLSTFDPARELGSLIPYTCGFNLTGQPAISIPCGFTCASLPIGLQVVGSHCKDSGVLQIAQAFQKITEWHEYFPVIP